MRFVTRNALIPIVIVLASPMATSADGLRDAVKSGDFARVKECLEQDRKAIHAVDSTGQTPLAHAILAKRHDMSRWLLEQGADPNAGRGRVLTPMHLATQIKDLEMLVMLISHGGDINTRGQNGIIPLQIAIATKNTQWVDVILDLGADINRTGANTRQALHLAVDLGNFEIVERLLDRGADPNSIDGAKQSPLHLLVRRSRSHDQNARNMEIQILQLLLAGGSNPDMKDRYGYSAVWNAQRYRREGLLKTMLDHGAEPDIFLAIQLGMDDAVREHIAEAQESSKLGQLFKSVNPHGDTPLHFAVRRQKSEILELLIESGANANVKAGSDITPLHQACQLGNVELVQTLVDASADVNSVTAPGRISKGWGQQFYNGSQTPLHFAVESGNAETVALLLNQSVDLNRQDFFGRTAMHLAVMHDSLPIVKQLAEHSAHLNLACWNDNGFRRLHFSGGKQPEPLTPLAIAQKQQHKAIAEYLSQCGAKLEPAQEVVIPTLAAKELEKLFGK
jgi:ankyrin repeat protein